MTLTHRHLKIPPDTPVDQLPLDALDDILERGDLDDWRALASRLRHAPNGQLAQRILKLCRAHEMYGTSRLWLSFIASLRPEGDDHSAGLTLAELRRRAGRTQADVAEALGITQSDVSKLERRTDLRVSTLQRYVATLGGQLQVAARVGDESVFIRTARPG